MAALLPFTQGACYYRQQLFMAPKLDGAGGSSNYYKPLIVMAKVKTRREDRIARHTRIRKKVQTYSTFYSLGIFYFSIVQIWPINEPNKLSQSQGLNPDFVNAGA